MSSSFGKKLHISIFGQSHSKAIGVVIDGLPAGEKIDFEAVDKFMQRRAPGKNAYSTSRNEADAPMILSGLADGLTCGAPLCAIIENSDMKSSDYDNLRDVPRPGHADYTAYVKFNGFNDVSGGGHFSGRLTAPLCFAGAVCMQILAKSGITIGAHIYSIGDVKDAEVSGAEEILGVISKDFPVADDGSGEKMKALIEQAKQDKDSVGGIVECFAFGVKAGIGEPMFEGVESRLSSAVFSIPAVKGVEFGAGFEASRMRGSVNNDEFYYDEDANIKTKTNNHGGILGGITSGMPIVMRVAFKPTPSIGKEQDSISLTYGCEQKLIIKGRHDPCIVPRALPCVEAATAIVLLDMML